MRDLEHARTSRSRRRGPESRISGSPTTSANDAADGAATSSDGTLPTVVSRRKCARFGMIAGFCSAGTREHARPPTRRRATKLMWPNESTPELPMNRYSATTIATLTSVSTK